MSDQVQWKRLQRELSPEQRERMLQGWISAEAENTLETALQSQQLVAAAAEPTLSGALRRAFHGCIQEPGSLPHVVMEQAKIDWAELLPFLLGEAPLTSDQIDRLTAALGMELVHHDAVA